MLIELLGPTMAAIEGENVPIVDIVAVVVVIIVMTLLQLNEVLLMLVVVEEALLSK